MIILLSLKLLLQQNDHYFDFPFVVVQCDVYLLGFGTRLQVESKMEWSNMRMFYCQITKADVQIDHLS